MEKQSSSLEKIEQLRKALVAKIVEITGLPIEEISVEVSLMEQSPYGPLAKEAESLGWYQDAHKETSWYTTESPSDGATVVFLEEDGSDIGIMEEQIDVNTD